jgi:hypothetical protein
MGFRPAVALTPSHQNIPFPQLGPMANISVADRLR